MTIDECPKEQSYWRTAYDLASNRSSGMVYLVLLIVVLLLVLAGLFGWWIFWPYSSITGDGIRVFTHLEMYSDDKITMLINSGVCEKKPKRHTSL